MYVYHTVLSIKLQILPDVPAACPTVAQGAVFPYNTHMQSNTDTAPTNTQRNARAFLRSGLLYAALFSCLALLLPTAACKGNAKPALPPHTPAPTASPAPTAVPSPTPTPAPKITDAWYADRCAEMRCRLSQFGGYTGTALDERMLAMEIDPDRPMIALTFDDGPVEGVTDRIVRILAEHNARATFFILGSRTRNPAAPELLKTILGGGNEIGNHTWQHLNLKTANGKEILDSVTMTNDAVFEITGYTPTLLRPPGGNVNGNVDYYAERLGMPIILWAQSGNVFETDPKKIAENVERQIVNGKTLADGDIVLLHDTNARMIEAVSIMVPRLIEQGYQLVTVSELLALSETGPVPGVRYSKQNP